MPSGKPSQMSQITSLHPSRASATAKARPMPRPAPVIRADRPVKRGVDVTGGAAGGSAGWGMTALSGSGRRPISLWRGGLFRKAAPKRA
ncbi:hypothetical protein GCM10019071_07720 [Sphingobium fuliginis]|uniref:Uncharacterized protein n=1 Tax=Sphingobium fuliginis (strain ATCC 27551) TaxID=336203 RepID=A0ABQ1EPI7_SPHSA|nr:hypothetical protein GCM10019071_07720 [Sphingobium fuliginis]